MDSDKNNDPSHTEKSSMEEVDKKGSDESLKAEACEPMETVEATVPADEGSVSQTASTDEDGTRVPVVETSVTIESSVEESSNVVEREASKNVEGDPKSPTENQEETTQTNNEETMKSSSNETPLDASDSANVVSSEANSLEEQSTKDTSMEEQSAKDTVLKEQIPKDNSLDSSDKQPEVEVASKASEMPANLIQTEMEVHTEAPAQSGLSLLAQYDSDNDENADDEEEKISDTDSVVEVPVNSINDYRNQTVEINSDSDSDSSSDSSSDVEYLSEIRKAIDKSIDVDVDDDDDDENGGKGKRQPPRVKGEFLIDDLPPIQDLHITVPEEECVELGKVHSIVDQLVLVNALPDSVLLDLDTVLFLDKGKRVLGEVFDVLGQVADPLYCVRFNSNKQIQEKNINVGDVVFVAPKTQYTQFVILSNLMKMRGSDASWENDIEPPPRYLDYSDDEQEKEARARLRNKDRPSDHNDPTKRPRSDSDRPPTTSSASPAPSQRQPFNNPHRGRGGFRPQQRYNQRPHSQGYQNQNYNAGSWHSNYPQRFQGPPAHYGPPPQAYPNMMHPPPNFATYPPHGVPMQAYPQPPQPQQHPPMYVLNPYAIRPSVLPPSGQPYSSNQPPPPPGSQ